MRILLLLMFSIVTVACGGGGGGDNNNSGTSLSNDATLSTLTLSGAALDQLFQPSQLNYTAAVNFLVASVTVTAAPTDANASVSINGTAGSSATLSLAEGPNDIAVEVTAEDGTTTQHYNLTITRSTAASFAQQAYLKANNAGVGNWFGRSVSIDGDTLVVGAPYEHSLGNAAGAAYVFTRSGGSWSQQAFLTGSNTEADDIFGRSVAIDGDTLVVGAPYEASSAGGGEADNSAAEAGAAYVFTRVGDSWSQQAYLKASNANAGDQFGFNVIINGDTLVVGAPHEASSASGGEADNSATDAGAAYVFTRSGDSWSQQAFLKASNADAGDQFGASVAINADTLVVGARYEASSAGEADNSAAEAGAAYVFTGGGASWSQQAYLKASNADAGDWFGWSVTIDSDTLVVGAPLEASSAGGGEADNSAADAGAAYVFTRVGDNWSQQAFLKASNADAGDAFGWSVDIDTDTLVVGAPYEASSGVGGEADNSAAEAGAAYVFTGGGASWSQQAYLKASNAEAGDQFGVSVAIDGDTGVVGAYAEANYEGAAYVWQ